MNLETAFNVLYDIQEKCFGSKNPLETVEKIVENSIKNAETEENKIALREGFERFCNNLSR